MKPTIANAPAWVQLCSLVALVLAGALASAFIMEIITFIAINLYALEITTNPGFLRLEQFVSAACMFLIPALVFARICSNNVSQFLSLHPLPGATIWAAVFVSMLLLSPSINLIGYFNSQLNLPLWMQSIEESAEATIKLLFAGRGITALLANLVVIAVLAGVSEEFFFRGALQRIIGKTVRNPHAVIWITAFIFSLIHLQFYGFVPRLILGAYFGYLLYWSRSIWIAVFAHFVNNAIAVLGMSSPYVKDTSIVTGDIPAGEMQLYLIASPLMLLLFFFCTWYIYRTLKEREEKAVA